MRIEDLQAIFDKDPNGKLICSREMSHVHSEYADGLQDLDGRVSVIELTPPGQQMPADWDTIQNKPFTFPPSNHNHNYEPANANIQSHVSSSHAPSNAQKNSDITKAEIEAKLTGAISTHTHSYEPANANIQSHVSSTSNPHSTTKAQVGLGNADNTADSAKPISTLQQAGLDTVKACIPNASYRTILDCTGSHIAARVAGTYWLGQGQPAGITGTGTLYAPNLIYVDSADYPSFDGKSPKLRLRSQVYCNDVAPFTGTFIFGLYPITRPATSGGAGLCTYTMGTVVAGSTVTLTNPVADSSNVLATSDFALPPNGHYVVGFVTSATMAASSHTHISAILQMRNN